MDAVAHSMWKHGNDIVLLQEIKMASDHKELCIQVRSRFTVHGTDYHFRFHGRDRIIVESWKHAGSPDLS